MLITIDAHEIVDADISKVSLVKRGANRTPFKIIKSEDAMYAEGEERARRLEARISERHGAQEAQQREDIGWLVRKDHSFDALERHAVAAAASAKRFK